MPELSGRAIARLFASRSARICDTSEGAPTALPTPVVDTRRRKPIATRVTLCTLRFAAISKFFHIPRHFFTTIRRHLLHRDIYRKEPL